MAANKRIKVLFVAGMYPTPKYPQKGIFCHEQVKALVKSGVDVEVVVPYTFYDREIRQKEWNYEGISIRFVCYFKIPGTLDFHRAGRALFFSLDKNLDIESYDIIHADAALPTGQAAMYLSKKYNIPYVIHGHGLDVFLDVSYKGKKNCKKIVQAGETVYRNAEAVIGVSRKVVDNVAVRVDLGGKAYVAYNGVDINTFFPVPHKNEKLVISVVGNLIPLKGHRYLFEAVSKFNHDYPGEISVRIIGRGYLEEELKDQVDSLGLSDAVVFIGYIPYDQVVTELQASDVFILPSYYEALGCVYLEAMACGLPAVGCYHNGIDEIIVDGENGFLVEEKDSQSIYEKLVLLRNPAIRNKIGIKARETVQHYTWDDSAAAVKKAYTDILNRVESN